MASSNNRRYSEKEIQAIFRRATERQEAMGTADPHRGLTLDELKAIGAESGIDPAHVEAAVADIERGDMEPASLSLLEQLYGLSASIVTNPSEVLSTRSWRKSCPPIRSKASSS